MKQYLLVALFTICFSGFSINLIAQRNIESKFVEGEVLVQLKENSFIGDLVSNYTSVGLRNTHTVSERFNIHLLKFDPSRTSHEAILGSLQTLNSVVNAQNNHIISMRDDDETLPNDLLFYTQWALENTGQNGGYSGSDIDATKAWDITTGGLTAYGDTIVIAIVDGGADLAHEDLDFWKNRAEIPNNNIDDDENGYIDDYDGWNAYDHTGDIPLHVHGTHVSGIAGAKGNNETGVSGVCWNAKILPVAGDSQNEATVVEALTYIYVIRETYDNTNGEKGAFVVVDNCSFGVNQGNPVNYPIWEAMYDSLGQLGILSIGATTNSDWDIDSVGDVPTAFSTPSLISVTNTTNKDKKYQDAGYGETTIDLGAPGTIVGSCIPNNEYKAKTGTSMAAPQVAGAVALLISAGDSAFIEQYKTNPAETGLLIKEYILAGVDTISDLVGKTVTGGRLNVFNSIQFMLNSPFLFVDPDAVYIEILKEEILNDTLLIKNVGTDTLNYFVTIEDQPAWITIDQVSGMLLEGEEDELKLTFNSQGLDTGSYYCTINIDGNIPLSQTISVEMKVVTGLGVSGYFGNYTEVSVFPNPFNESLKFSFDNIDADNILLQIFNLEGKQIFQHEETSVKNSFILEWNDSNIDNGFYFYRITFDNLFTTTGKILKQ